MTQYEVLTGYADRLSALPGEALTFRISSPGGDYEARLVRLYHGLPDAGGPGPREVEIPSSVDGVHRGRPQRLRAGSCVRVPWQTTPAPASFTVSCWVYATAPATGRRQAVLSRRTSGEGGWALGLDADGSPTFWTEGAGRVYALSPGTPLVPHQWYFLAAAYDAARGEARLHHAPLARWPGMQPATLSASCEPPAAAENQELVIAAWCTSGGTTEAHFNGKVGEPFLRSGAAEARALAALATNPGDPAIFARWDFRPTGPATMVPDRGPHGLNGVTHNTPMRAVTGRSWSGREIDFRLAVDEYDAMHFHEDDLTDAEWDADFELTVPDDAASGVYAVRVRCGDQEDHIPFVVRPAPDRARARAVVLLPTLSYLAYANSHVWKTGSTSSSLVDGPDGAERDAPTAGDAYIVANPLHSIYDTHIDGSGVCYASRLRPLLSMRPAYRSPLARVPHQLSADLCLIDWLDHEGLDVDVITDEDLHQDGPAALEGYAVVLLASHPEYWTWSMLSTLDGYLSDGGSAMYLGGNGLYWVVGIADDEPHVIEVRRGYAGSRSWESEPGEVNLSTTGEPGGLWRHRGWAPQRLVGVGTAAQGFREARPFVVTPGATEDPRLRFIFEGVDTSEPIGTGGLIMGAAGGHELDRADTALGTPPHAAVIATATGFTENYQGVVEEVLMADSRQSGPVNPAVRADMVFFEGRNGGGVFSTGSIAWCGALSHDDYDNPASTITANVLQAFLASEPSGSEHREVDGVAST